jgi:hypothetical protein
MLRWFRGAGQKRLWSAGARQGVALASMMANDYLRLPFLPLRFIPALSIR